jgi:hypothetical protein
MKLPTLLLLSALSSASFADSLQNSDGIYSTSKTNQLNYHVDSKTQLCFATSEQAKEAALVQIDCSSLAKRSEWKDIITWLDKPIPNEQASYRPHR